MKKHLSARFGFTLIELMIVIAIIAIIAAIAIPNLLRARASANEGSAISSLRTLVTSQTLYREDNNVYAGDLATLSGADLIDRVLGSGQKSGYLFFLSSSDPSSIWEANADPAAPGSSGNRYFFVDQTGVIRESSSGSATNTSTPIVWGDLQKEGALVASAGMSTDEPHLILSISSFLVAQREPGPNPPPPDDGEKKKNNRDNGEGRKLGHSLLMKLLLRCIPNDMLAAALRQMDTNKDNALSFDEVLNADVLTVARGMLGTFSDNSEEPQGGIVASDSHLDALSEEYLGNLARDLQLGIANEDIENLPAVPLKDLVKKKALTVPVELGSGQR